MIINDSDLRDGELLDFLAEQESVDVGWGNKFSDEFAHRMRFGQQLIGDRLPWDEFSDKVAFAPGELTVHAGMNSHRKSMVLGQLSGWFALQGSRVGVMSFEMPVVDTMRRMCLQMAGTSNPGDSWWKQWVAWNESRICYYDKRDTTPADRVLAAASHMARNLGCKHIVIDSLTKCGLPYGEGAAVKEFIDVLVDTARKFQTHIHLVAHVRKPEHGDSKIPSRYDIRGAGEISDLAHNVIIHWANVRKKRMQASGKPPANEREQKILDMPCQIMVVDKQRNGAWDGSIGLTFHESMQFHRGKLLRPNITARAAA